MASIEVKGMDQLLAKLDKMKQAVSDLTPAFADMEGPIIQEFTANFPGEGEVLEKPWPPRLRSYPWPILVKTGTMKGNWSPTPSKNDLKIVNPTPYAGYHHFGTPKLPVRKLVGGSTNIDKIAHDRILLHLKKSFL